MWRKRFSSLPRQVLTTLALVATLGATTWAKPKFKILHTVPGGLFSGLTFDAKGNLYGVTSAGGDDNQGTIFELTPGSQGWTLTTLHSFNGQDGGSPNGGLIFDAAGNMYGTTVAGGKAIYGGGTVFEMTPGSGGWTFNVLYEFCLQLHCPDGSAPEAGVIIDRAGTLYGTTSAGGEYGGGAAFELTRGSGGWKEALLYNFCGKPYCADGATPYAPLIFGLVGHLYGTTASGGKLSTSCYVGCGTVFKLQDPFGQDWKERVLYDFHGYDGQGPLDAAITDSSGNLYGTTRGGGGSCEGEFCGVAFKLSRDQRGNWEETMLYRFLNPAYGFYPSSALVFNKVGDLYGTTAQGGGGPCYNGCGVLYKLSPSSNGKWKYNVLHKFIGNSGTLPPGNLVLDEKGNIYGAAYGAVYEVTP